MRHYVLVLLRTGPHPVTEGAEREAMFKGHMANIQRLASAGKLALAGPLDGKDGLRGMFVFAVEDIEQAKNGGDRPGDHPRRNGRRISRVLRERGTDAGEPGARALGEEGVLTRRQPETGLNKAVKACCLCPDLRAY